MRTTRLLRYIAPVAVLLLLAATLLAACSGSDETTSSDSAATTEAQVMGASGSIVISGMVDYAMTFNSLDMDYMSWQSMSAEHPERGTKSYEGVPLGEVFDYVGVLSEATTVTIWSLDGTSVKLTLSDIPDDALIAVSGEGTLNAVMPGMSAEAWVEDVVSMELR